MRVYKNIKRKTLVNQTLLCMALTLFLAPVSWAKKEQLPEVDSHGLHLVKDSKVKVAYVLPGADFSLFSKVKILDCYVAFKKNYMRDYNLDQVGLEGMVTTKEMDEIKVKLAAEFKKEFTKVLEKKGHEVVDTVGPDVLLLRPALINLYVAAPDTMQSEAFSTTIVSSAGYMTLYMELYDSGSNELLARVIDPEGANNDFAERANIVTNTVAADQIIQRWANMLSDHLEEAKTTSAKH